MDIYKITNKVNNKIYIGKTERNANVRWNEHKQEYMRDKYKNNKFYNALKKYGLNNFYLEIIETNILSKEELNIKEKYYIELYDAKNDAIGYNTADGGDGGRIISKLTLKEVKEIQTILLDENNLQSFSNIAKNYNINTSVISYINKGDSWTDNSLEYPLRKYNVTGLSISRQQYTDIVNDIINNPKMSLTEIRKKYNLSEEQITNINQGYHCYNNKNEYYKNIYTGNYPIRNTNKKQTVQQEIFKKILYDVLFTKESIVNIGKKYNIQGNTITYILLGKRRKELTKNFIIPIRKNLKENQQIFKNIYPDFQGGD